MNKQKRIFVLGKHRSGTSWLATQLTLNGYGSSIDEFGLVESGYFDSLYRYCNKLETELDRKHFSQGFLRSRFYRNIKFVKNYELQSCHIKSFIDFMDATFHFWVEKSPSNAFRAFQIVKKSEKHLYFLIVKRNEINRFKSAYKGTLEKGHIAWLKEAIYSSQLEFNLRLFKLVHFNKLSMVYFNEIKSNNIPFFKKNELEIFQHRKNSSNDARYMSRIDKKINGTEPGLHIISAYIFLYYMFLIISPLIFPLFLLARSTKKIELPSWYYA